MYCCMNDFDLTEINNSNSDRVWIRTHLPAAEVGGEGKAHKIYAQDGLIIREVSLVTEPVDGYKNRIEAASKSSYGTPLLGWLTHGGNFKGWVERYIPDLAPFLYFEQQHEVFTNHCKHQAELITNGFYDMDAATINWAKTNDRYFTFDKDGVYPLDYKFRKLHFDINKGGYFMLLNNGYSIVNLKVRRLLSAAMQQDCRNIMSNAWLSVATDNLLTKE